MTATDAATCSTEDFARALEHAGFRALLGRRELYLTWDEPWGRRGLRSHPPACAVGATACEVSSAISVTTWGADGAGVRFVGAPAVREDFVTPCSSAPTHEHVVVAAAKALGLAHQAPGAGVAVNLVDAMQWALRLGLPPETSPGLWEQVRPDAVRLLARFAQAAARPAAQRVMATVRAAQDATRERLFVDPDTPLGQGPLRWVVMQYSHLLKFMPSEIAGTKTQILMKSPLRVVLPLPDEDSLLAWHVPASYAHAADRYGAAIALAPVSRDETSARMMLKAVSVHGLDDGPAASRFAQAFAAAQA